MAMRKVRFIFLGMALMAMLLTAGCDTSGGQKEAPASSSTQQTQEKTDGTKTDQTAKEISIRVYYPNEDGTKLLGVSRKVTLDKGLDKYTAAVQSLLAGPKEKGLVAIFPKAAKLRRVTVENGIARVDFDQSLVKHFNGGSTGEEMLVGSLVDTLTEFSEVREVQLLIKTCADRLEALSAAIVEHHPYELPEIIAVSPSAGLPAYLDWIRAQTREES